MHRQASQQDTFTTPRSPQTALALLAAGAAGLALCACGGGGGSGLAPGAVDGLEPPAQLSIIQAEDGSGGAAPLTAGAGLAPQSTGFAAGADYETDESELYVYDSSMESLDTVNMILTYVSLTGAAEMVNQGAYIAFIDEALVEKGGGDDEQGEGAGQSSGAGGVSPEFWTLICQRATNASPQTVKLWKPENNEAGPAEIRGRMTISEEPTEANPFGQFELNFVMVPEGGSEDEPLFFGTLQTLEPTGGQVGFLFFEQQGDVNQVPEEYGRASQVQVNVRMSADQTTGVANIVHQFRENWPPMGDTGIQVEQWQVAFDEEHLLRKLDDGAPELMSRVEFQNSAWRYNLYDAVSGERVELNSGFGVRTEDGDFGWIGYWGLWLPEGIAVTDGMTLVSDGWGDEPVETYTAKVAPGKLIRRTKGTLALTELDGELFQYWEWDELAGESTDYLVSFTGGAFTKVATYDEEWQLVDLETPVPIVVAEWGVINLYSNTLGGDVAYAEGDSFVTYYAEEFVTGADELFAGGVGQVVLYNYLDGLRSGITSEEMEQGDVFMETAEVLESPHHFVFDASDMTLYHDPYGTGENLDPVGLAEGEGAPAGGPFYWGLRSGPMLVDTSGLSDPYQSWGEDVIYVYETGPNSWNQYVTVIDELGETVSFDPPLQFVYTHSQGNDANDDDSYAGKTYQLEYKGPGDLHGIPHDGVDLSGDGNPDRWYPLFTLLDGTLLGPTGVEYVSKATEVEQTLSPDAGDPGSLTLDAVGALVLPTALDFTAPVVGAKPVVTDPPAVINGEVQIELE